MVWTRSEPRAEALGSAFPLLRESPVRLAALFLGNSSATGSNKAGRPGQRAGSEEGPARLPWAQGPGHTGSPEPPPRTLRPDVFLARGGRPRSWGGSPGKGATAVRVPLPMPPAPTTSPGPPLTLRDCSPRRCASTRGRASAAINHALRPPCCRGRSRGWSFLGIKWAR